MPNLISSIFSKVYQLLLSISISLTIYFSFVLLTSFSESVIVFTKYSLPNIDALYSQSIFDESKHIILLFFIFKFSMNVFVYFNNGLLRTFWINIHLFSLNKSLFLINNL